MAARRWRSNRSVEDLLEQEPYRFEFLQAVRILEAADKEADPVGTGTEPDREAISFAHNAGLGFPASEIDVLERPKAVAGKKKPAKLVQTFFGLTGNLGPLPQSFAELIHARAFKRDRVMIDFLNLFVHRLVSIFVRAKKKHKVGLELKSPEKTHFADYLYCLLGIGTEGLKDRMAVPDRALLMFAALAHQKPRSATGLEILLSEYFGVPAQVNPFIGRWLELEEDETLVLSAKQFGGKNNRLGSSAVIGSRIWCEDDVFEVKLGPMSRDQFMDFLPVGKSFDALTALVRFYVPIEQDFRVRLSIEGEEAPQLCLSADPEKANAYLGWTTWLKGKDWTRDDSQVCLTPSPPFTLEEPEEESLNGQ